MTTDTLLALVLAFFTSWQVKVIVGLIALDLGFGIFAALRRGTFDFDKVALFYRTDVLPYIGGYALLYGVIRFVLPLDKLGGDASWLNEGAVTFAGLFLAANLLASIRKSYLELYPALPGIDTQRS